jgi:hypothetical protein
MEKLTAPNLEDWFEFWVQDLIDRGYILKLLTTKDMLPFVLFDGLSITGAVKNSKNQFVGRKKNLLERIIYTPDFTIIWAEKAKGVFYIPFEEDTLLNTKMLSHTHNNLDFTPIEVKAPPGYGGRNTSDASFRVKQKWTWEKYKIFVQKVYLYPLKPKASSTLYLWQNTFTPTRYFMTDGLTKERTINKWSPVHIDLFLAQKKPQI